MFIIILLSEYRYIYGFSSVSQGDKDHIGLILDSQNFEKLFRMNDTVLLLPVIKKEKMIKIIILLQEVSISKMTSCKDTSKNFDIIKRATNIFIALTMCQALC